MENGKLGPVSRFTGIDIIKILAVMLVPSLHFFENYGFVGQPYINFSMVFQETIRWISFTCIGLFLLSTGYLQCNRCPGKYRKILKYVIPYLFYCVLTVFVLHGINFSVFSNILYYFLRFPAYFWYMSFYLGFYLLIPYLNLITKNMDKKQFQILILTLFIVISLPNFVNSLPALLNGSKHIYLPSWWSDFFPVIYYFIGVYFRKYQPRIKKVILIGIVLIASFGISLIDFKYSKGGNPQFFGGGYGSALTVLLSVCIFALFYNLNVRQRTLQALAGFVSGMTLNIYLGLIVSDKLTSAALRACFPNLLTVYHFKLYFIEVPLNFLFALLIALFYSLIDKIITKLWTVHRKNRVDSKTCVDESRVEVKV